MEINLVISPMIRIVTTLMPLAQQQTIPLQLLKRIAVMAQSMPAKAATTVTLHPAMVVIHLVKQNPHGFLRERLLAIFCGFEYFQHEFPCDLSLLTHCRKQMGEDGVVSEGICDNTLFLLHWTTHFLDPAFLHRGRHGFDGGDRLWDQQAELKALVKRLQKPTANDNVAFEAVAA